MGASKGGGPMGGRPKMLRFFFPSPATNWLFLSLWGVFSCHFGGVIVVLGLSCEAPFALEGGPAVARPAEGVESGERPNFGAPKKIF